LWMNNIKIFNSSHFFEWSRVKERKIIHENSRLVPNVFENMLYISQHCRRFHCVFKYWSCKIEEKEGKEVIFLGNQVPLSLSISHNNNNNSQRLE
jgi:hypothetical protein